MKFVKRPVMIEANQWFKHGDNPDVLKYYTYNDNLTHCGYCGLSYDDHGFLDTLEGGHIVCPGDWIIIGVKNERYPCKPDIFEATYEKVND